MGKVSGTSFDAIHTTQGIKLQKKGGINALNGTHGSHAPRGCLAVVHFHVLRFLYILACKMIC